MGEYHQKGGDTHSSWSRVMKVTKKTERTSKTEQSTKTFKVIGSGDQKRVVECTEKKVNKKDHQPLQSSAVADPDKAEPPSEDNDKKDVEHEEEEQLPNKMTTTKKNKCGKCS